MFAGASAARILGSRQLPRASTLFVSLPPPPRFRFRRPSGRTPHEHGALLRALAYRVAEGELEEKGHTLRCSPLDAGALAHWRHAWRPAFVSNAPAAHWRWDVLHARLRRDPYRFELAVWGRSENPGVGGVARGDALCGLALGVLSNRRRVVRVQYLARSPVPTSPLKGVVGLTAATVAEAYARVWGAAEVRFEDPLPGADVVYRALGYALVRPAAGKPYFVIPL